MRAEGDADLEVALFLGDESGTSPRRVPELRRCAPTMLNQELLTALLIQESANLHLHVRTEVALHAFVDTDGAVDEIRVDRTSGYAAADQAAVRVMRMARFRPATIEGIIPTEVWASFPVTFRVERR
jgi:TonB family protein